jgi:EmrB/QacA subfamily drug resistance transporter
MSLELPPGRRRFVFAACVAAIFTAAVEGTIVATAMPTIVADLGGFSMLAWVFAAYMLTQAVTIPIYGRLADLYGRKRVLFFGLGIFLIGCVLCGFAPSMLWLVIFRAIQGIGAGAILPVSLTIVGDAYPALERVKIQPYLAGIFAGSSIVGPSIGAFIVQHMSWQLIFWFNIPIGIIAIIMLAVYLQEKPRVVKHKIDVLGAILLMASITGVLVAMLEAPELGWWVIALLAASAGVFFLFLRQERQSPEPLLPSTLWRDRTLFASNVGSFAVGGVIIGVSAFLPTYLQGVMGDSVLKSGIALTMMSFAWPLASTIGSRIMIRTTYRTTAVTGGIVLVIGALSLAVLTETPFDVRANLFGGWSLTVAAFVVGAGLGFMNSSLHISMQEAASSHRGIATATVAFMRTVGGTFGAAILGAALNISVAMKLPQVHDPVQIIMDPVLREKLPPAELTRITEAVGESLGNVFWITLVIALISAAIVWMVPHVRPGLLAPAQPHRDEGS